MDNKDFSNIGEQIRNTIEEAMGSMNYQQLNQKINQTVDMAMNEARKQFQNYQYGTGQPHVKPPVQPKSQTPEKPVTKKTVVRIHRKGHFISIPLTVLGFAGTGTFLAYTIASLIELLAGATIMRQAFNAIRFGGALSAMILSIIMLVIGIAGWSRYINFNKYLKILDGREFCAIKEIAEKTNQSVKTVCKKIKKMIKIGMLPDGFIDEQGTCLIVTKGAYEQFCQAQESRRQREAEEARMREEQKDTVKSEIDRMIEKGNEYINCIRAANDAIPGEVISAKLDRLELVVRKIFESVKQHPEQMDEMDKFMEYYLPTTQKLVNAYKEFDALPVKGENVTNSMNEIENTLDTISYAFEQLLDDLFQDTTFDISADISVLQTMFAREGYKEKDFK